MIPSHKYLHVKYRKVNQTEIEEIYHISKTNPVNQIPGRACHNEIPQSLSGRYRPVFGIRT